ncbi:MAG TPA: GIDE domain-containing protein, partial [Methyloceanibacter sp.]|nr:GIDE domain-containing protein [Methyloceanibacter sp.]
APFEIEDASGRVRVLPEGAIIEGVAAVDRHESHAAERPIPEAPGADVTLARRFREMHLPIDSKIYVLGVVGEDGSISAPRKSAKGQRFLISVNTEEARTMEPAAGASGCSGSALPASSALSCRSARPPG